MTHHFCRLRGLQPVFLAVLAFLKMHLLGKVFHHLATLAYQRQRLNSLSFYGREKRPNLLINDGVRDKLPTDAE